MNVRDPSGWVTQRFDWGTSTASLDVKMRNLTVAAHLWAEAAARPHDIAILFDDGQHLTYGAVASEVRDLAAALQKLGLRPGERVSAQLPSWREFVAINLACCALGLVFNPIIPIYRGAELRFILKDAGSRVLFVPERIRSNEHLEIVTALRNDLPDLQHVVVVRPSGSSTSIRDRGAMTLEELLERGRQGRVEFPFVDPNHVKLVMYTSGTTGYPKGVLHTHNTMARVTDNIVAFRALGADDVQFMGSPVTHITGYGACESPFTTGVKAAILERWDKVRAVDFIEETRSTFGVGATPFLQELIQECQARRSGLPSMKHFACGGAAVPAELIRQAHKTFERCRCFRVYGSTEVPLVSQGMTEPEQEELAATTDGHIFNYEVRVTDADGAAVAIGGEGELLVRGPAMMVGYTNAESTRAALTEDGFFRTGDLGRVDGDGNVIITGRKKDLIIRGGENISAKEIEDALHAHERIQEAAVVSMPHPRLGEGVAAYVRLADPDQPLTVEAVAAHIHAMGLARQKAPEHIEMVDDFPRTASGKIRKDLLREDIRDKLKARATQ